MGLGREYGMELESKHGIAMLDGLLLLLSYSHYEI